MRLGVPRDRLRDLYHWLIELRWSVFLLLQFLGFSLVALGFALIYWWVPGCLVGGRPGSFADAYYFSVQTMATIGYGVLSPAGDFTNVVVCVQAYVGVMSIALMSGLAFSKFSVPQARVMFSDSMVVRPRNGVPTLQFRLANARSSQIVEARIQLTMARDEVTEEGEVMRRLVRLPLSTPDTPVFALSFQANHPLDQHSPLHGWTREHFDSCNCDFIVTLMGLDATLSQTVHARYAYNSDDIRWNHRFEDVISWSEDNRPVLDLSRFHRTESLSSATSSQ